MSLGTRLEPCSQKAGPLDMHALYDKIVGCYLPMLQVAETQLSASSEYGQVCTLCELRRNHSYIYDIRGENKKPIHFFAYIFCSNLYLVKATSHLI
jgi:hypothetical protein